MPKYYYECQECETILKIYHSMSETKQDCEACETKNTLKKIPNKISYSNREKENKKVGSVVKQSIEDFRSDLEEQKQRLKNELYGTDN